MMERGDTPEAACYNTGEEAGYRQTPHQWEKLIPQSLAYKLIIAVEAITLDVCPICGAVRKTP